MLVPEPRGPTTDSITPPRFNYELFNCSNFSIRY